MTVLPYVYEFHKEDLEGIRQCNEHHGFAIVKDVLPQELVESLKADVRMLLEPRFTDDSIQSVTEGAFIEQSPVLTGLMAYEPVMKIIRYLHDDEPITLNRSAAIYKKPGAAAGAKKSGAMAWHTDWAPLEHPYNSNGVLNTTGAFFLLVLPHRKHSAQWRLVDYSRLSYSGLAWACWI